MGYIVTKLRLDQLRDSMNQCSTQIKTKIAEEKAVIVSIKNITSSYDKLSIALTTTIILSAALLTTPVARANDSLYTYNPTAEVTTKFSKGRNIAELNYMQPFLANDNQLSVIDLKLKMDNQ